MRAIRALYGNNAILSYEDVPSEESGSAWRAKWRGLLNSLSPSNPSEDFHLDPFFSLMLNLYAHHSVVDDLRRIHDYEEGYILFYLPQLCNFWLFGGSENHEELETFLLEKCKKSLPFAQRILWFVLAYGNHHIDEDEIVHYPQEVINLVETICQAGAQAASNYEASVSWLCLKPKLLGEITTTIHLGDLSLENGEEKEDHLNSIKHPHLQFIGIRPLPRVAAGPPHVIGTPKIRWSESFFQELAQMSVELKEIPEQDRNRCLRTSLHSLCNDFIPASQLSIPVKSSHHVVANIITDESFCFKTKERVPFMICFEIIDHDLAAGLPIDFEQYENPSSSGLRSLGGKIIDTMERLGNRISKQLVGDEEHRPMEPNSPTPLKSARHSSSSSQLNRMETPHRVESLGRSLSSPQPSTVRTRTGSTSRTAGTGSADMMPASVSRNPGSGDEAETIKSEVEAVSPPNKTQFQIEEGKMLGQFTPAVPVRARGAGYDHFSFHKNLDLERVRDSARERAKKQLQNNKLNTPESENLYAPSANHTASLSEVELTGRNERGSSVDDSSIYESNADDNSSVTSASTTQNVEDQLVDENFVIFRERWCDKEYRIRQQSKFGSIPGWRLVPIIVKSGDDLRQEQFASQLIKQFCKIFKEEGLDLYLRPYDVLAISPDCGLIEAVPDTISLDSLKKNDSAYLSLKDFFTRYYGKGRAFRVAQRRFCDSLAAYCIVCYLLQIKDRHNGNLLLHADGHLIHIDFGFMLSNAPGNVNFETAPFKLTNEFVQLLGGPDSRCFMRFRSLCMKGYLAARKHRQEIILLVEMLLSGNENLPCFYAGGKQTVGALEARFNPHLTNNQCKEFVDMLISTSLNHWRTTWYDRYQKCCVGIM